MTRSTAHTTSPRLFLPGPLHLGAEVAVSPAQAHYLGTVLRRAAGDAVRVFNGLDGEWLAHLTHIRRDRASLTVSDQLRPQTAEPGPWLVFALLKRDATDLVVRQAVELGVSRILPVLTERTNAAHVNQDRLRAIATEAAEQSERLCVPPIDPPTRLENVLAAWPPERRLFAALERWASDPGPDPGPGPNPGPGPDPGPGPGRGPGPGSSASPPAPNRHPRARPGDQYEHGAATDPRVEPGDDGGGAGDDGRGRAELHTAENPTALLIGPEGGFSPTERQALLRSNFVTPISLGPFILRAETAAAAGLALLPAMGWAD